MTDTLTQLTPTAEQHRQAAYIAAQSADMRVNVEIETDDGMTVNLGPQHPATHGTLRLIAKLDGEQVIECEPVMGYMHRGYEKLTEVRTYPQITTFAQRHELIHHIGMGTCRHASASRFGAPGCREHLSQLGGVHWTV